LAGPAERDRIVITVRGTAAASPISKNPPEFDG